MKYVIDANILIGFSIYLPEKYYPTFWAWLEEKIRKKEIVILNEIADECKDNRIGGWIKEHISDCIVEVDNDVILRSTAIENKYKLITKINHRSKSEADSVLIAYAERNRCCVLTRERAKKLAQNQNKIPDVCRALGVSYERFPEKIFKNLGFKPL